MLSNLIATLYNVAAQAAAHAEPALAQKKIEPTAFDKLGAVVAMVVMISAGVVLLGTAIWMIYKALTQPQSLQTSWNPPQEAQFEAYAEIETRIHSKSWMFAFVSAALVGVVAIAVYFGVKPKVDKAGETMDLSTFDKKAKAPAPGPGAH